MSECRRKNYIPTVTVNGTTTIDHSSKVKAFWEHFSKIIGSYKPHASSLNLHTLDFNQVNLSPLDEPVSEDEVILELHPEKAPGPDGYTGLFYRLA